MHPTIRLANIICMQGPDGPVYEGPQRASNFDSPTNIPSIHSHFPVCH